MSYQKLEVGENPRITIVECAGNLKVVGDEAGELNVHIPGDANEMSVEQTEEAIVIKSRSDCRLTCPPDTTLVIETVHGNAKIMDVQSFMFHHVSGNATVMDIETFSLDHVSGNLRVQDIAGDVTVGTVSGNLRASDVDGKLSVENIAGNLRTTEVRGGLEAGHVSGEAHLTSPFGAEASYSVVTDGRLVVNLEEMDSVRFALQTPGEVRVKGLDLVLEEQEGTMVGQLGEGSASLTAKASGQITLKANDFSEEFGPSPELLESLEQLGPMIEATVAEAMERVNARLREKLQDFDGEKFASHIERAVEKAQHVAEREAERVRRTMERETEQAEREAKRTRRQAEREAERARMRAEQAERRWQRASGQREEPPQPETDRREERMQVLKLVEEGKLSPSEAADLLSALS